MKNLSFNQWALRFALLMLVTAVVGLIATSQQYDTFYFVAGISAILFCLALSYGLKEFQPTKGLSFTMWILASVCIAMFFPKYFIVWGTGDNPFVLEKLITPLLQIIMFGVGAQLSFSDLAGVMKRPGTVAIGVIGRYTVGPLLVLALVPIFRFFAPEAFTPDMVNMIIAGFILVAVMPCGLASNVMVMLANANVALAVTIGATTTLLAPFVVPPLMQLFAGSMVELNTWGMMFNIFKMVAFPIIAGFIFNLFNQNKESVKTKIIQMSSFFALIVLASLLGLLAFASFCYFKETAIFLGIFFVLPAVVGYLLNLKFEGDQTLVKKTLGKLSQIGIFTIVLVITAAGRDALAAAGGLLVTLVILHNTLGYGAGYCLAWLFRMPEIDRRTLAFEVGMPNAGAASGLAMAIGPIATAGLAPAIYGPVMNIFGSTLASIWKGKPIKEEAKTEEK